MRFCSPLWLVCMLWACTAVPPQTENAAPAIDPLQRMLHAAAVDAAASLRMLAQTNNAAAQKDLTPPQKHQAIIAATRTPAGMERSVTVGWAGPVEVEAALATLAKLSDYTLEVVGDSPTPPIIVYAYSDQAPVIDLVRDVAFQAGDRAVVDVFEPGRKILLRYPA